MPHYSIHRFLCPLLLVACCQACSLEQSQSPAQAPLVPSQWQELVLANNSETAADSQWWRQFDDETLNRLIKEVFQDNLSLDAARERIIEANASYGVVEADKRLQLAAALGYTKAETGDKTVTLQAIPPGKSLEVYSTGLHAGWELDLWGRTAKLLEAAEADIQATYSDYHGLLVSLAAEMAIAHFQLQALHGRQRLVLRSIAVEEQALELTEQLCRAGSLPELNLTGARARVAEVAARLPEIEQGISASRYRINALRGRPPQDKIASPTTNPDQAKIPPLRGLGLPAGLISRRPDIVRALHFYQAAAAREGAAATLKYPTLSITGNLTLSSDSLSNMLLVDSLMYSLGPSLSWPLMTGGRIESNIAVHRSRQEQARLALEDRLITALAEVESAAAGVISSHQRIDRLTEVERQASQHLRLNEQLFTVGLGDMFTVLNSRRQLLTSQDALLTARLSAQREVVQLYRALGGGWETAPGLGSDGVSPTGAIGAKPRISP